MTSKESSYHRSHPDVIRQPSDVFHSSVWGDYFIALTPMPSSELEKIKQKIDELKDVIKKMLRDSSDQLQSLEMIDAIHHLGVAYHFELEINEALKIIYKTSFEESNDLYTVALGFRLLRQQRFSISADIFTKFIDKEGDFKDSLSHDAISLLSLYNAAYLGTPSEKILENAAYFARTHLKLMLSKMEPTLTAIASRALETPRFRRIERLEAREYLSTYEEEKNRSKILLEFAKFDFLFVQSVHLEELRQISLWKNYMALAENIPFARDRLVELHFWMIGAYFEPCYSRARIMTTKVLILTSMLDDIYDQYGALEELEMLTEKINRWELEKVDQLPKYLQYFCMVLHKTFKDFEDELAFEQNSFRVEFLRKEHEEIDGHFATIVESYAKENTCTKEEACKKLRVIVEDAWKTLNKEYFMSNLPLFLVQPIVNLTRVIELFYKDNDNYTNPFGSMKDNIKLVMVEPIFV